MANSGIIGNQLEETAPATILDGNSQDLIRLRAYELFEERGRVDGFAHEDWLRAEIEILAPHRDGTSEVGIKES